ncbi:hypothetical protein ACWGOQ_0000950 [Aquimarina sp. M1]
MKTLDFNQMENVQGGTCLRASDLVCGGMGLAFGFVPVIGWALGAGVGLACAATWEDVESSNPAVFGCDD